MDSLGIAIDGGRYVRVDSRIGDIPKTVRLRTLSPGQNNARLDFCVFGRRGTRILKSHKVSGLRSDAGTPAEISLRIERRTFAGWEARVSHAGARTEILRFRTRIGLWPLIVAIPLLLFLLAWGFLSFADPVSNRLASLIPERSTPKVQSSTAGTDGAPPLGPSVTAPASADTAEVSIGSEVRNPDAGERVSGPAETAGSADSSLTESSDPAPISGTARSASGNEETGAPAESASVEPMGSESRISAADASPETDAIPERPDPLTVYFRPESAVLESPARRALDEFSGTVESGMTLEIIGHSAQYGTERGQMALSLARARAVASYLAARLSPEVQMRVEGRGTVSPATLDPDRQELNRRVRINPVGERNDR